MLSEAIVELSLGLVRFGLVSKMNGLLLFHFMVEPKALTQREQMRKMTIPLLWSTHRCYTSCAVLNHYE